MKNITILANNTSRNLITRMCRDENINIRFQKKGNVNVILVPLTFKVETILREVRFRLGPHAFKLKERKP